MYDITYYTEITAGKKVKASGVYFVPRRKKPLSMMIYNHGTVIRPERHLGYNGESTICLIFASDGYAVAAPDYVGLGHGEGTHLYHHVESTANAGIDLLRIAKQLNETDFDRKTSDELYITGYSQGGHATLAIHKTIEEKYSEEFKITASSPMSGAYDLSGVQSEIMFVEYTQPHYLPYLFIAYNEAYNIFQTEEEFFDLFQAPYDSIIPVLFDKKHNVGDVNNALPKVPENMMDKEVMTAFVNDKDFFFTKLLEKNNLYDWKPSAPVQLCYCEGDEEVLYQNSIKAHKYMTMRGAKNVRLKRVSKKLNHFNCAGFAAIHTKFYFDAFRKGRKRGGKGPIFKRMLLSLAKRFS